MASINKHDTDNIIKTVTVASGASLSEELVVEPGYSLVRVIIPASYDGGNISFDEAYESGGTYYQLNDAGDASTASAELIINTPGTAARAFVINPTMQVGAMGYLKVDTASNVGADRDIILVFNKNTL